jgi:probable phosphoglycerate mutase
VNRGIALFTRPFYFLRHGETETNAAGLITGQLDVDLTSRGRQQALAAAQALAREPITGIYVSPLRRARETAEPIARRLGLPLHVIGALSERQWGALEGCPRASRVRGITPRGAETPGVFASRVLGALAEIDEPVPLIVAHSGVFRVLCRTLEIVDVHMPVSNALPQRFVPLAEGGWRVGSLMC